MSSKWSKKHEKYTPPAPQVNIDLEQGSEKKLNDVKSFNNSIENI